jgi:surface protein
MAPTHGNIVEGVDAVTYNSVISSMSEANESNFITEENFYLLQWLYRIRRASCARGLRVGFIGPDFLWSMYMPMMRSKKLSRTDVDMKAAVNLWCSNRAAALKRYGHISDWDVSSVTDMSELFKDKSEFNDGISQWDVSKVANMGYMFWSAQSFNQPVGNWDVSNVINMHGMFEDAYAFNQPVGDWDVCKVTDMGGMFEDAYAFNQEIGNWDVSNVTDMKVMFYEAHAFNQDVGAWNVSKVTNTWQMFAETGAFNQDLTRWDMHMRSVEDAGDMFFGARAMQQDNMPVSVRE